MTSAVTASRGRQNARSERGGSALKRRTGARADKDGDLAMGSTLARSRGGISKNKAATGPTGESRSRGMPRKRNPASRLTADLAKHGATTALSTRVASTTGAAEDIRVTGWANSKASTTSEDGGVSALITWIERKATMKSALKRPVKIKKSKVETDLVIVTVPAEHVATVLRLNGFEFAGKNIKVEKVETDNSTTNNTIAMLRSVLARRYNPDLKLLDLSALGQDPDLQASAIFDSKSTTGKFFPAMMKVLDKQFATQAEKNEAIQSVTLAHNELSNLTAVTTLSQTLPQLKNLDLSNNHFAKVDDLSVWRKRFSKLDHLIISNNPVEQSDPDVAKTLVSWFARLRLLNNTQVRTDEEAANAFQVTDLPFPVQSASFRDEGQIAENFIRTFFTGFDTDRPTLAKMYYDSDSTFSFSVNTAAPRDPNATDSNVSIGWEDYIRNSRNLKKITQAPARLSRLSKGLERIMQSWSTLPITRHPDLVADAKRWLIECQLQPGVSDPTGQSVGGVDGFLITIHGEFDEMDVSTGQAKMKRSFDRTFLIGPGGSGGVRVVNDMLTVRAYGGVQAFEPTDETDHNQLSNGAHPTLEPALPQGLTTELAEQMVLELQKQTQMTIGYAKDCLEQVSWDFNRALEAFAAVRASLPAQAFIDGATT